MSSRLKVLFNQYPFVTVTGPRQSGKTTLCRSVFPNLRYANLESPETRAFAQDDPRAFLAQHEQGAIIDEVQYVPELLSYLQVLADERRQNGLFVLTGSQQFELSSAISQSLAGRTALLKLLPLSLAERRQFEIGESLEQMLFAGFYPRIYDQGLDPQQAFGDYFETYVERDVRRIGGIRNLTSFRRFVRLCAGRVGQLVNLTALGSDAGVSHTTARQWLEILEESYIAFRLEPFSANLRKRLVRSPKLYFFDVGLASYLIGIESPSQLATHPLRGPLFENLVVAEAFKHQLNRGQTPRFSFFRDSKGLECDLLSESVDGTAAIEIKSGSTVSSDFFNSLARVGELIPTIASKTVVYGGTERQSRRGCLVVPVSGLEGILDRSLISQEVAEFISDRRGQDPGEDVAQILDSVYFNLILPVLEGVTPLCQQIADDLFGKFSSISKVSLGSSSDYSKRLNDRQDWELIKAENARRPGFGLRAEKKFILSQTFKFSSYSGVGSGGFDLEIAIKWGFDRGFAVQSCAVDGNFEDGLNLRIPYSRAGDIRDTTDRMVAEIIRAVMAQIDEKSKQTRQPIRN